MSRKTLLEMKCPGINCTNGQISTWQHNNCGGKIMIDENGYLSCNVCNISRQFYDWRFSCQLHKGDYQKPDYNKVLNNFIGFAALQKKMGVDWLIKLTTNLVQMNNNFL